MKKSKIVVIDDKPDEGSSICRGLRENSSVESCEAITPEELDSGLVRDADLILVDYKIDHWPSREELTPSIGLMPSDGVALAAVLRRHLSKVQDKTPPTAIAIITGALEELTKPLPPDNRIHVVSRLANTEWVFEKSDGESVQKIVALANAVVALPSGWSESGRDELVNLLGIETKPDHILDELLDDISTCMPPVHEISKWSHGLSFVRWLLHRVIPYPNCLWDKYRLAARFRVKFGSADLFEQKNEIVGSLEAAEYRGVLRASKKITSATDK